MITLSGALPGRSAGSAQEELGKDPVLGSFDYLQLMAGVRNGLQYMVDKFGVSDCRALADFANIASEYSNGDSHTFVSAFSQLTPLSSLSYGLSALAHSLSIGAAPGVVNLNRTGQPSGFAGMYQDVNPNDDQAHHFAMFLQIGYRGGFVEGAIAARVWEIAGSTPNNLGDIRLGEQAARIGNTLRLGGSISEALSQMSGLCKPN